MSKRVFTKELQQEIRDLIDAFNKKTFKGSVEFNYIPKFKGDFLYLDRIEFGQVTPVVRLQYSGDMMKWKFAIYKWSRDAYDADEWFFPGVQHVDGTIEGAMRAGLEAYPV